MYHSNGYCLILKTKLNATIGSAAPTVGKPNGVNVDETSKNVERIKTFTTSTQTIDQDLGDR